jgi:hypothetical protein
MKLGFFPQSIYIQQVFDIAIVLEERRSPIWRENSWGVDFALASSQMYLETTLITHVLESNQNIAGCKIFRDFSKYF